MAEQVIEVRIWNQRVGAVAADPRAGCHAFEYDPRWRRGGVELAPLTLPLAASRSAVLFPSLPEATYRGLPGLLSDALPDDFGNALIDAWMAREGVPKGAITALDRLAYMGKRGMGALEFRPARGSHRESARPLEMKRLVEAARAVVTGTLSEDDMTKAAIENIIRVGTSAGGARAKAVIAWNPTTSEVRSGQFDVAEGFEHWLLKFDGLGKDSELGATGHYGRIEYAYHLMAVAAGVDMEPCRLLLENGRAHFMTKRFDRDNNAKHHVQTLCAMQHLDYKQRATHAYEQYLETIATLGLGHEALDQAFTRACFNVATKNCDDHTKNFAFRLREGAAWELAPAYDITHAYNPKGEWTYQHLMSINGQFARISERDLLVLADRFGVRAPGAIIRRVDEAVADWAGHAEAAGVPASVTEQIRQHHHQLAERKPRRGAHATARTERGQRTMP